MEIPKNTTVVYHSADFDGIFCCEIARKFLGEDAEYIGWNFGDPPVHVPTNGAIYIMDLPPTCIVEQGFYNFWRRVIWIDHHASAMKEWDKRPVTDDAPDAFIAGYRIDGVAACRLAWYYFKWRDAGFPKIHMPGKQNFVDRIVAEPLAVRLVGEYDVWDKRDPNAEIFQYGLRLIDRDSDFRETLLQTGKTAERAVFDILELGKTAQLYAAKTDASICLARTWLMEWEGLRFLCVNSARFNSLLFVARDNPETGHDALLGFCFDGKCWTVSLYHAKHRTELDLSLIAVKHGGGGHRGACGFTCGQLPFAMNDRK